MDEPAIRVTGLGKRYKLGEGASYGRLTETLTNAIRRGSRSSRKARGRPDHIWALRNVSFEVNEGEVVGIIGNNGAGKSTLLKLLARITEPTEGRIELIGRVGSLLEVGTGFHPELTGRENVFLNGAILGMGSSEIRRKFTEIVAFAEVEAFLDTPVKRYSTGMAMRLAFSIAAHLEPEVLLIDEVLAVGDAAFQQRSLGKMGEVARQGRTVIFVSHNLPAVQRLCERAYLLAGGAVVADGPTKDVIERYHTTIGDRTRIAETRDVPEGTVRFLAWQLRDGVDRHTMVSGAPTTFEVVLLTRRAIPKANFGFAIWAEDGTLVWATRNIDHGGTPLELAPGEYRLAFSVPGLPLRAGDYQILVSANDLEEGVLDAWHARPTMNVAVPESSELPVQWQGLLDVRGSFRIEGGGDAR